MKLLYFPLFIMLLLFPVGAIADPIDHVAVLMRQGNVQELSSLFAPGIDLSLMDEENFYSKSQARVILSKFFEGHTPLAVKILHKVNSNPNYLLGVLFLTTGSGIYRVAFTLKKNGDAMEMIELRIEVEKTK